MKPRSSRVKRAFYPASSINLEFEIVTQHTFSPQEAELAHDSYRRNSRLLHPQRGQFRGANGAGSPPFTVGMLLVSLQVTLAMVFAGLVAFPFDAFCK